MALSSRGLGRGPLKAQTRVRIPLALLGPIVYRLGRDPFKVQRGVRLPLGLWWGGGQPLAANSSGSAREPQQVPHSEFTPTVRAARTVSLWGFDPALQVARVT